MNRLSFSCVCWWVIVTCLPLPPRNTCYLICRIEIEDSEAVGISSIISNLITVFPRTVLTAIPSELFSSFVNCLTHLTCSFGRSAALEEVVSDCSEASGVRRSPRTSASGSHAGSNFKWVLAVVTLRFCLCELLGNLCWETCLSKICGLKSL